MSRQYLEEDYQTVSRSRARRPAWEKIADELDVPFPKGKRRSTSTAAGFPAASLDKSIALKRGHFLAFAGLYAFTVVLYARPSDLYPSALTANLAFIVGVITLAVYVPTQLALEGKITAPLGEVKLVLLFALTGLASIPLAINPTEAWNTFSGAFVRCVVMFIVIVNVVRTERRLNAMLYLALGVGAWLSFGAINDYRLGLMTVEGYRVAGRGLGIFGNSNDMALFLVTMVPIAIALLIRSRALFAKALFAGIALLMIAAIVLTYSRGGFIALVVALAFLAWRFGKQHRAGILLAGFVGVFAFLLLAPGGYGLRLASIVMPSLDPVGSSDARRGELIRSLFVALRHPLLGIGMGNYAPEMSYNGLVTHNSYTQVAAEMGLAALYCYTMFIIGPLRKLRQLARDTLTVPQNSRFYYLAVGLQAALIAYLVCSFFASVAYLWYVFYLVGYGVCLCRLYENETGKELAVLKRRSRASSLPAPQILTAE
jgi:O-antigen ligase